MTRRTAPPNPPSNAPVAATGDALLLGLASVYRQEAERSEALQRAQLEHPTLERQLRSDLCETVERQSILMEAMSVIQATGLHGVQVQLEMLRPHLERDRYDDDEEEEKAQRISNFALWSIYRVIAAETGRPTETCIDMMTPAHDPTEPDVRKVVAEWKAMDEQHQRRRTNV